MHAKSTVLKAALLAGLVAFGCDEAETRDAAKTAGDNVEKAITTAGEATRTAADNVGGAMERAGQHLQNAANDPATLPATQPVTSTP
jgi:hypothetical protein